MTIVEFLKARIAEDEVWLLTADCECWDGLPRQPNCPDRVLAECEAKRRIVELHSHCDDVSFGDAATCPDMCGVASIYADHPDYDPAWRP